MHPPQPIPESKTHIEETTNNCVTNNLQQPTYDTDIINLMSTKPAQCLKFKLNPTVEDSASALRKLLAQH